MKRRSLLAGFGAAFVAGCSKIAGTGPGASLLDAANKWNLGLHDFLGRRSALAREFSPEHVSPFFRGNGTVNPQSEAYQAHAEAGFAEWRLEVTGLVETPLSLSLDDIKALPQRSQITRHDCVEGWSAIGKWTGPQLSNLLEMAGAKAEAKYVVFRCADTLRGGPYYESVDMIDALHPQTIIAHMLNDEPLPVRNGAPLRMRIERQLGYKHAKYLIAIELVASLDDIGKGGGGYWEDRADYQWYAGI